MIIELKISKKLVPYKRAMNLLEKRVVDVQKGKEKELLWILEHPRIYTGGVRSKDSEILDKRIEYISTNRGGKITLHNPGQKIVYFVINLNKRKKDIRRFINIIEKSVIEFLKIYKINGKSDKKNIGIWVKSKKISAIGIRVKKWIAYHGFSLNISNDLKKYDKISPCGLDSSKISNLSKVRKQDYKKIREKLIENFIINIEN